LEIPYQPIFLRVSLSPISKGELHGGLPMHIAMMGKGSSPPRSRRLRLSAKGETGPDRGF
jgi:hypothetical protein